MTLATIDRLADRLYAGKPASAEGDLALAAWRRAVHAVAEISIPTDERDGFLERCRA